MIVILLTGGVFSAVSVGEPSEEKEQTNEESVKINVDTNKELNKVNRESSPPEIKSWYQVLYYGVKCLDAGYNFLYEADKEVTDNAYYKKVKTEEITFAEWWKDDSVYHVEKYMPAWKDETIAIHPHEPGIPTGDNVLYDLSYAWHEGSQTTIIDVDSGALSTNQYCFTSVDNTLPQGDHNSDGLRIHWSNDDWQTHELYQQVYTDYDGGGGGCPFIATWNGEEYTPENNILWESDKKLGSRKTVDVNDHYIIKNPTVKDGKYSIQLQEFEQEISYIDQAKLMAVDHPENTEIAVAQKGKIITYDGSLEPKNMDTNIESNEVESLLTKGDRSIELKSGDYITMDYSNKLIKTPVLLSDIDMKSAPIDLKMYDGSNWKTVKSFLPRCNGGVQAIDLSEYRETNDLKIKLEFNGKHTIDYLGLADLTKEEYKIQECSLTDQIYSNKNELENKLLKNDQIYTQLKVGEKITLNYDIPEKNGMERDLMFVVDGFYTKFIDTDHALEGVATEKIGEGTLYTPMLDSYDNVKTCRWEFSDGTIEDVFQPYHTHSIDDDYQAKLTVVYEDGETKTIEFVED